MQLLGGLVLLIYAGDALVRGAVSMARRLDVPPMIVGLTVIAFGTSAPELMVGIDAVLTDVPTLALGNVVGSNIANIWLVIKTRLRRFLLLNNLQLLARQLRSCQAL